MCYTSLSDALSLFIFWSLHNTAECATRSLLLPLAPHSLLFAPGVLRRTGVACRTCSAPDSLGSEAMAPSLRLSDLRAARWRTAGFGVRGKKRRVRASGTAPDTPDPKKERSSSVPTGGRLSKAKFRTYRRAPLHLCCSSLRQIFTVSRCHQSSNFSFRFGLLPNFRFGLLPVVGAADGF